MKRVISWLLAVALLLTLAMPVAMAANKKKSGLFFYTMKGNGTAIISGFDGDTNGNDDVYVPAQIDGYTVSEIGSRAFADTNCACVLMLPNTITTIGEKAFANCGFTALNIPASVEVIENDVFHSMKNIKKLTVDSKSSVYASIDGVLYNKLTKTLIAYPYGADQVFSVPSGILAIGEGAFQGIKEMDITMPSSITRIDKRAFANVALGELIIPNSVEEIGEEAFLRCNIHMRRNNQSVLYLPSSIKSIGRRAFEYCYGSALTNDSYQYIDLSDTQLTEIPEYAFSGVVSNKMAGVYLPETLTSIGTGSFIKVNVGTIGLAIPEKVETIGISAFAEGKGRIRFHAHSKLKSIGEKAFSNFEFIGLDGVLVLPNGLKEIADRAFDGIKGIEKIVIPPSVEVIGEEICDRARIVLDVEPNSYAEFWASENGYLTTTSVDDLSWLEADTSI